MVLALRHTLLESSVEHYDIFSIQDDFTDIILRIWFGVDISRKNSTYVENWGKIVVESFSLGIRCDGYFVTVNGYWISNRRMTG